MPFCWFCHALAQFCSILNDINATKNDAKWDDYEFDIVNFLMATLIIGI